MQEWTDALVAWLIQRRSGLLLICLLLALCVASALPRTGFDTSLGVLLTRSDPYLAERDRMAETFPAPVELSFALLPDDGTVFTANTLLALADLNREFRQLPGAVSMNSIVQWQSPFGDFSLFPRVLTAQNIPDAAAIADARERVRKDPFLFGSYVSSDEALALTSIRLNTRNLNREESAALVAAADTLRDSLQSRYPDIRILVNSEAHYEQSNRDAMLDDLMYLLPVVLLLCTAVICYSFRSLLLGACILVVALITVLMTVGTLAWAGWSFNTISVMAPLVVVTIAVADSVHIVSLFRQHVLAGGSPQTAMQASLRINLRPITLATITTFTGFAALNLASAPAVSSFGSVVAVGVAFAYFLTLALLPALVLLVPVSRIGNTGGMSVIPTLLRACEWLALRHGRALLIGTTGLGLLALVLSFRNTTDFDRGSFISEDSPLHEYYSTVQEHLDRGTQLGFGVEVADEFGLVSPDRLRRLDEFSTWLREQDGVTGVASLVEVVKTVHQIMRDDAPEAFVIPDTEAEIEDALFNYTVAQASDFTIDTLVNEDFTLMRLFVTTDIDSNQALLALSDHIDAEFTRRFPDARLLHGSGTLLFARMDHAVTLELLQGYGVSLALITLTLVLGMGSLYYGLLSMLPNLLPAVLVFGTWGLFVGRLDPFVMMLFSISIGLVVDDTVHMLSTYHTARRDGLKADAAIARALHRAGPALVITTVVLALGTCVLIAASTLYFQQAATLLVPIVVVALVLDLTFFPALLMRIDRTARPNDGNG